MQNQRVLIVAPNGPEVAFGGGQRNLLFIRAWQARGFKVDLAVLINEDWQINEETLYVKNWKKEFGLVRLLQIRSGSPFTPSMDVIKWLTKNSSKYKYIIYRDEPIAWKAGFLFIRKSKNIIDYNDFILPNTSRFQKIKYFPLYLLERIFIKKAICMDLRHKKYFKTQALFIPNFPLPLFELAFRNSFSKKRSDFPSIIFVSSYLNIFMEFINHPNFHEITEIKNIKIFIISRAITPEIKKRFDHPAFEWLDNVEDLKPYYEKAWISIVPGHKKDGPLIKFIESIYFRTPVVCTNDALLGYEFFNENEILVPASNDESEMIENIKTYLSDSSALENISNKLYQKMQQKFSFNELVDSLPS